MKSRLVFFLALIAKQLKAAQLSRRQSLVTGASSILTTIPNANAVVDTVHQQKTGVIWSNDLEAPPLSLREYRSIILESGLRVCLCLAPGNQAEVAFASAAGQLRDTPNYDGLSHLTEHLTMTNIEFAVSTLEAGYANAETRFDRTIFYSTCDAARWDVLCRIVGSALSRQPFFDAQICRREVGRVDAELKHPLAPSALEYDQLIRKAALPNDPLSRFGPGNRQTLLHDDDSGLTLARLASDLYQSHYEASQATLAIIADAPDLDTLETVVVDAFQNSLPRTSYIKKENISFIPLPSTVESRTSTSLKKNEVVAAWKLPYAALGGFDAFEQYKPHVVASHLIAYAGPNSISTTLQQLDPDKNTPRRYVSAGILLEGDSETGYFIYQIRALGPFSVKSILQVLNNGLKNLRSLSHESLLNAAQDCKDLADLLAWNYPLREPTAVELVNDMRRAPPLEYLTRPRRFDESTDAVAAHTQRLLNLLSLDSARVLTTQAQEIEEKFSIEQPLKFHYYRNNYAAAWSNAVPRSQKKTRPVARIRQEPISVWHAPGRWHVTTGRLQQCSLPLMSLVAFYPAPALNRADDTLRDAGHSWIQRTRQALAAPFFDAVLAGHKYEIQYVADTDGTPGFRLALAGFPDAGFQSFAIEFAHRLYHLTVKDQAAGYLWTSMTDAVHNEARVLVAGDVDAPVADKLALDFTRTLLPGALLRSDTVRRLLLLSPTLFVPSAVAAKPDPPPPKVLLRPASWDHPVAKNLGLASGIPSLIPGCTYS